LFIEPGSRWEEGPGESVNGGVRDGLLDRESFYSVRDAKCLTEMWRGEYNHVGRHSSLGYIPLVSGAYIAVAEAFQQVCPPWQLDRGAGAGLLMVRAELPPRNTLHYSEHLHCSY
jgi:hypothetical protein